MTTIAYHHKDGQIAVDSRSTCCGTIVTDSSDKTIKNDIGLWVLCGQPCDYETLTKLNHNDKCDTEPDCSALLIKDGEVFGVGVGDGICSHSKYNYNFALGSGTDFALSAMDHGKDAEDAVKYAMTRDIYSGGKVQVIDVKTSQVIS